MASSYKCTSVGCYSLNSPETNTLFQRLQTVINQFAAAAAFDPIKIDGIIGKGTTQKALIVLGYLGELDKGVVGSSARALEDGINGPEQLAANAAAVADTLTLAARQPPGALVGQVTPPAALPPPTPAPSSTQIATTPANQPVKSSAPATQNLINTIKAKNPALSASLLDVMPPWLAYASGALLAAGAITAVVVAGKKRKASIAPAVAGRWYR